jgi:GTP-binding protein
MMVANKADNEKYEWELFDFLQVGLWRRLPISASQGRNTGNFLDELISLIPKTADAYEEAPKETPTRTPWWGNPTWVKARSSI